MEEIVDFEPLIERASRWVVDKGLATPVVFLLEMHKPVAPLGSMMMLGAMPFLGPFIGFGAIERFALFAEDRSNVEKLIKRIEKNVEDLAAAERAARTDANEELPG
ncbi:MAG: hypothetical protein ACYTKD_20410 [Planctomycetota bacterium]